MSSYTIKLKNCGFFARHGVFNEEESLGQRFFVDAELKVKDTADTLENDDYENVVDYGEVFKVIESIVCGKRRFLIEKVARETAKAICASFPAVTEAKITVRKPNAPVQGVLDFVEVVVTYPDDAA